MGLLDKIKGAIGSSKSVVYNPDCPEIFWEAVKEQLSRHHDVKMGIPKGRAYSVVHSLAHKGFMGYCFTYSVRDGQAAVFYETYQGDEARDMIMAAVANAPEGHPVKQAIMSQGKKNKDKWAWTITRQADASDNGLLQWYVDTFLPMYEFLENLPEFQKTEKAAQAGKKQHIRVEIQIAEHDYAAFDADEFMVGDTYAFNGDGGVENFELYVDGELYDFGDDDPMDVVNSKYSDYKKFDLAAKWDNEEICSVGYYENMALLTWEFDVDNFEVEKLSINYDCYDVCFDPADYETESHILSLSYNGKTFEPSSVGCSDGDLEQIWSKYDDEDDEEIEDESSEPSMSLSEKFGILAATMAGIDGSVEKDEIDIVLTIIQQNSEPFDIAEVRTALVKELKGIQEYESQSAIVKSIKGDDRELIFQALIMVAVADFKLRQDELGFLSGIADLWEWDWDDCAGMIRMVIENVQEAYGREIDVEE